MGNSDLVVQDAQLSPEVVSAQSIVMLIVYLLLIVLGIYFLTKFIARRSLQKGMKKRPAGRFFSSSKNAPGGLISVADRIAIDRDKTVMAVEFQGKYYLLGTTSQEINLIDSLPVPPEDREENREEAEADGSRDTGEAASYHADGFDLSAGEFFRQLWGNIRLGAYRFFHRGGDPRSGTFEAQLRSKLEADDHAASKREPKQK